MNRQATPSTFHQFPGLPIEVQLYIWDLALDDSVDIQINWTTPHMTTAWPLVSIRQTGAEDKPGLIPYVLPKGTPTSINSHPPPYGMPDPNRAQSAELFALSESVRDADRGASEAKSSFGVTLTKAVVSRVIRQRKGACDEPSTLAACLATCRASRLQATRRRPSVSGAQQVRIRQRLREPAQRSTVPCLRDRAQRIRQETTPANGYRLAAGRSQPRGRAAVRHQALRLRALTTVLEGTDSNSFRRLGHMMWWQPKLGHRARRPEANHPWHMTPDSISHVYSTVLHHLVGVRTKAYPRLPECLKDEWSVIHMHGKWHTTLVREGKCHLCDKAAHGRSAEQLLRASRRRRVYRYHCH
ncbi:hypothetical protein GGR53DRAFT_210915 [Hypoxylon sp. FL1150]|nr:hypothetical protein GGR53DRAFT_210915 [Hypoxylon sp. FL1150]